MHVLLKWFEYGVKLLLQSAYAFTEHVHSFLRIHGIYLVHPCNRCTGGGDASGVRGSASGGGAGAVGGARGADKRRKGHWGVTWVPWSPSIIFSERQDPVHANPTFVYISFEYFYLFIALSCRSWVKTLAALYLCLSRYRTWIPIKV
jgi:hypothetical protein